MKEITDIQIRSGEMTITVEGEHEIFGGVDLQIEAIIAMIETLDFNFC
ncbi:hypothetical protein MNQ98_10715 [Paenibacillus sp. N3/727]|nr:hypothetical protein [Paenibacillus sp. N3/727]UNK20446.1 hypothetical protein MNQ98_10715 [Paenibacillus sp. N3/727]